MGFVNWWAFIIQTINLGIILYVLNRFLFRPYLRYIDSEHARRAEMERTIAEADSIRAGARQEAEAIVAEARRDAEDIRNKGKILATKETENIIDAARIEADSIVHRATEECERDRRAMEDTLRSRVLEVAIRLNGKLFGETQTHRDFVAKQMEKDITL